ncbi:MIP/aquaporin family protein [Sphingomonas sp. LR55]|uniref:MIP/aquaporin family protein n=1 Tax=Sphingomonas sp. LR55 TaxID=3050231 RepID=UPI002FE35827
MTPGKAYLGELISEAIAIFIVMTFGLSVAAMYTLYDPSPYKTAYWGVCMTWGMAVSISIYVTGAVSGTHANPGVTLALALYRGFPWRKVLPYWCAQLVGAFLGAALVYALYYNVIDHFNATQHMTRAGGGAAGVFFTAPGVAVTTMKGFIDEIILTAILVFGIFAITDEFNTMAPQANFGAIVIGLLVAVIGASMGYLEAWAINPARSRTAYLCLVDGLGRIRVSRRGQLLVGPDRRAVDWRSNRRRRATSVDPAVPATRHAHRRAPMTSAPFRRQPTRPKESEA